MSRRVLFFLFILSLTVLAPRFYRGAEASSEHGGGHESSEHVDVQHDGHAKDDHAKDDHGKSEVSHSEGHGEDHKDGHDKGHGDAGGEGHGEGHGGGHHIWWTFQGYEIPFAVMGCIYFALVLLICPKLFGKHEHGEEPH